MTTDERRELVFYRINKSKNTFRSSSSSW